MSETISFSLPEEITEQIKQYAKSTRRPQSTVAAMAFEKFFQDDQVKAELLKILPSPEPQNQ